MLVTEVIAEEKVQDVEEVDVYTIPATNWGRLEYDIGELNKKAKRIGASPIVITKIDEFEKDNGRRDKNGDLIIRKYFKVKLIGETPKLEGWHLVAAIDYDDGMVVLRVAPGEELPEEFRNTDASRCDFCHSKRDRVNSYIVQHENGEYKQVGRSCLKNFLGHKNPKQILSWAEIIMDLDSLMDDAEDDSFGGGGPREKIRHDFGTYLAFVSCIIRHDGWVPKSAANKLNQSTAHKAWEHMYPDKREVARGFVPYEPTEKDVVLAGKALEWVREIIANKNHLSDYEHNLVQLTNNPNGGFDAKYGGFVASIIPAYQRYTENQVKYAERVKSDRELAAGSDYVGTVGQRFGGKGKGNSEPLVLKFLGVKWLQSNWGSTGICRFMDEQGNFFTWFASNSPELEPGETYLVGGTIKKHEEDKYNHDAKTTYITRANIISEE